MPQMRKCYLLLACLCVSNYHYTALKHTLTDIICDLLPAELRRANRR